MDHLSLVQPTLQKDIDEMHRIITDNLKGKRFFAVSIDKQGKIEYYQNNLSDYDMVYNCEFLKMKILQQANDE